MPSSRKKKKGPRGCWAVLFKLVPEKRYTAAELEDKSRRRTTKKKNQVLTKLEPPLEI